MDFAIFVVFLTYFVIPLSLRIVTGLGVTLSLFHLLIATIVAAATTNTPGEIIGRQV